MEWEKSRGLTGADTVPIEAHLEGDQNDNPKWTYRALDLSRHMELMRLARSGDYGTGKELAKAMGLTPARVSQLKKEAIAEGVFTSRRWNNWLRAGQEGQRLEFDTEEFDTEEFDIEDDNAPF